MMYFRAPLRRSLTRFADLSDRQVNAGLQCTAYSRFRIRDTPWPTCKAVSQHNHSGPYVTIEPMLYWRDRLEPIHMRYLSPRNRERFGAFAANPAARQFVRTMRERLRDIMDAHGAVHSQLGRFYRTSNSSLDSPDALLMRLKAALDPDHRFNPGVLGIPAQLK